MLLASVRKRIEGSKSLHSHSYTSEYTLSLMSDSKRKQTSVRVCVCAINGFNCCKVEKEWSQLMSSSSGLDWFDWLCLFNQVWMKWVWVCARRLAEYVYYSIVLRCLCVYLSTQEERGSRRRRFVGLCLMIIVDFWRFDCQLYAWAKLRRNTGCGAWHCGST